MQRTFSSYGPVYSELNYYVPRSELIDEAYHQLLGEAPEKSGHYFTVWAPRQTGKTWIMANVLWRIQKDNRFYVAKINLQSDSSKTPETSMNYIIDEINTICHNRLYLIEVKSFTNFPLFKQALHQSAKYAQSMNCKEITLAVFVEHIPDEARKKYEQPQLHEETGVTVQPVFIVTGN